MVYIYFWFLMIRNFIYCMSIYGIFLFYFISITIIGRDIFGVSHVIIVIIVCIYLINYADLGYWYDW
jgi:hypothetical protein